jgi:hypothetical protein
VATYRERRLAKAERLRGWAEGRESKAEAAHETASRMADAILFGQPILVGHHSEGRDRRYRSRIASNMDKVVEHSRKAESMRSRADNIEAAAEHAIYSDDPDVVERLEERIADLEAERDKVKTRDIDQRLSLFIAVDALDPATLVALIQKKVEEHRDRNLWDTAVARDEADRQMIEEVRTR